MQSSHTEKDYATDLAHLLESVEKALECLLGDGSNLVVPQDDIRARMSQAHGLLCDMPCVQLSKSELEGELTRVQERLRILRDLETNLIATIGNRG